jgi:carboxypeptidase C (cathepsin A)
LRVGSREKAWLRSALLAAAFIGAALVAPGVSFAQPNNDQAQGAAAAGGDKSGGEGGSDHVQSVGDRHRNAVNREVEQNWASAPVVERQAATHHSVRTAHGTLNYTATAGTLTIRNDEGMPTASMFYVAYTLNGSNTGRRPVTFFYNGGPGSSTVWLHMGSFGPMRVQTGNPETIRPAPFAFGPNPDTLLDQSDLVFLDMIGTGYSRALGDTAPTTFWGVDQDADAFSRGIMCWVTKNNRWGSPKFLFGESYGTLRSAAVAYQLQDRGMALNGVVLLSTILNYGIEQEGYDTNYIGYFPSYAATAWYHHKAGSGENVEAFVQRAREFAIGPYASALAKGQMISPEERASVARQMSAFIGISPDYIERANLRVSLERFRKELLRDQRLTIGRLDSRYTGIDTDAAGSSTEYDPSNTAISGAFVASFSDYVSHDLNYHTDMNYQVEAYGLPHFDWDWKHKPPRGEQQIVPDVALDLSATMRVNPYLRVLSLNGYYDMATPFFATEYDMAHMMLEPGQQRNLEFRYYPSGHMIYLNPEALHQLHHDLSAFYEETVERAATGHPAAPAPHPSRNH